MRQTLLDPKEKMARKAGWASLCGTTIEWYDFYVYGTASALIFGQAFFSPAPHAVGVLLSFLTFWVGFLARPLGAVIFGHIGDRVGRKKSLVTTLTLMGGATVGIGLLPTYAQIGIAAPILLTLARVVQGIALGGEWGGAVLIATEHAKRSRSFMYGLFAQQGSPLGRILATLSFIPIASLPDEALMTWAWRIPFLASAILVIVGLVIRLRLEESPAIVALKLTKRVEKLPIRTLFRDHRKAVTLGIGACFIIFTLGYARDNFALAWASNELGFDKNDFLTIILIASVLQFFAQPAGAWLATRYNPRTMVIIFLALELPALPLMFILVATENWWLALAGTVAATIPDVMYLGMLAGMFANGFPAAVRYTGISTTYALSAMIGGGMPALMQTVYAASGSIVQPIALTMVACAISLVCAQAFIALPVEDPLADDLAAQASETPGRGDAERNGLTSQSRPRVTRP
ncbi:MAG: MFS transporter [Mycobacterium sp.]